MGMVSRNYSTNYSLNGSTALLEDVQRRIKVAPDQAFDIIARQRTLFYARHTKLWTWMQHSASKGESTLCNELHGAFCIIYYFYDNQPLH